MSESFLHVVCLSEDVKEKGKAVRFMVAYQGKIKPAFVIRYHGQVYGYLNQCAHQPVEMDWQLGEFWGLDHATLVCSMHGAGYLPESGMCIMGPCKGARLIQVPVLQKEDGQIYCEWEVTEDHATAC